MLVLALLTAVTAARGGLALASCRCNSQVKNEYPEGSSAMGENIETSDKACCLYSEGE